MKNFVTPNSHPSSFLTGSTLEAMVDKFKELGTGYYVCTDNGYLTNALKAYNLAKKKGLKPILGCEIYVKDDSLSSKIKYYTITLHARNQEQYQYLVKQLSDKNRPTIEIVEQEYQGQYIRFPCLLKYQIMWFINPYFSSGINFGYLLKAKYESSARREDIEITKKLPSIDISIDIGAGVQFKLPGIYILTEVRCLVGLSQNQYSRLGKWRNYTILFILGMQFR